MDSSWRRHPRLPWRKAEGLKICVTFPGMQLPGEVWNPPPDLVLTLSLPDRTWELLKNLTSLSQSCRHVYCMTILQEEFWCFVNVELFEHCVCVTEQCPIPPPPTPTPTSWAKSQHKAQSLIIYNIWLPIPDALWTCEVICLKNGCCGDCVWYYCSYLSF